MDLSVSDNEQKIAAIRNLLFGKEVANLTALIQSTEKSLLVSQLRIKDSVDQSLQNINRDLQLTNNRLTQLEKEVSKLSDDSKDFVEESRCHRILLKNKIELLVDQLKQLESQIDSDLQNLSDSTQSGLRALADDLETGLAKIGSQSTAREQLGELLIEMGVTIQGSSEKQQQIAQTIASEDEVVLTR